MVSVCEYVRTLQDFWSAENVKLFERTELGQQKDMQVVTYQGFLFVAFMWNMWPSTTDSWKVSDAYVLIESIRETWSIFGGLCCYSKLSWATDKVVLVPFPSTASAEVHF